MFLTASVAEARSVSWQRKTRAEELRLQLADEIVRGALCRVRRLTKSRLRTDFMFRGPRYARRSVCLRQAD